MSSFLLESNVFFDCWSSRHSRFSDYDDSLRFPDWRFVEHLSHALPTEMIFYLLQSIDLHRLQLQDYGLKSMLDLLKIIIKWLEVSVSIYDRQTQLKSHLCLGTWIRDTKRLV